jgi:hypothetical protein
MLHFFEWNAIFLIKLPMLVMYERAYKNSINIFDNKIYILDKVYAELVRFPNRKREVDNIIIMNLFKLMSFPEENADIRKEYALLKKGLKGESACMAIL